MKRLTSCCCCCTPRTGAIVLATLALILHAVNLMSAIKFAITKDSNIQEWDSALAKMKELVDQGQLDPAVYETCKVTIDFYISHYNLFLGLSFAFGIIMSLINGSMLFGVLKNKHKFILPWTIVQAIGIILQIIGILVVVIYLMVIGYFVIGIAVAVGGVIGLSIIGYFWIVVHSVYLDIKDMHENVHEKLDSFY